MTKQITPAELAEAFSKVIKQSLSSGDLALVRARNVTSRYVDACATHDFCDSNMAMLKAYTELTEGAEDKFDVSDMTDAHRELWNEAWAIAKKGGFGATPLVPHPDGSFSFDHGGIDIVDPFASECGRFQWSVEEPTFSPAHYGFNVVDTGGGCTSWRNDGFMLPDGRPAYMVITDTDGTSHTVGADETMLVGVYALLEDADNEESLALWERSRGAGPDVASRPVQVFL